MVKAPIADNPPFQVDEPQALDPDESLTANALWAKRAGYDLRWDKTAILLKDLDERGVVPAGRSKQQVHKRREGHEVDSNSERDWKSVKREAMRRLVLIPFLRKSLGRKELRAILGITGNTREWNGH